MGECRSESITKQDKLSIHCSYPPFWRRYLPLPAHPPLIVIQILEPKTPPRYAKSPTTAAKHVHVCINSWIAVAREKKEDAEEQNQDKKTPEAMQYPAQPSCHRFSLSLQWSLLRAKLSNSAASKSRVGEGRMRDVSFYATILSGSSSSSSSSICSIASLM